jgi:ATP-dependent RNA helicase DDX21
MVARKSASHLGRRPSARSELGFWAHVFLTMNVDLVIQFDPPRDVDTYVHRSGRTGRAGNKGVSVLLFNGGQSRDIVRIERELSHGFKFELAGPPSIEAALNAAAKTSAIACRGVPDATAKDFKDSAKVLLSGR